VAVYAHFIPTLGYLLLLYGIECDLLLLSGIVSHDRLLLIEIVSHDMLLLNAIAANWYCCYL